MTPTILSVIPLPDWLAPTAIAGCLRDGRLVTNLEGAAVLVTPPHGNYPFLQEVHNLSHGGFRPQMFFCGVRILGVFGTGRAMRVRLWGRPVGEARTGLWVWTIEGLRFKERLDELRAIRRGTHEGSVAVGRNTDDPFGFSRYFLPGRSVLLPTNASVQFCSDGSVVSIDPHAERARRTFAFGGDLQHSFLPLPPVRGFMQHIPWGKKHLFFTRSGVTASLWGSHSGFLDMAGPDWVLEQAWGSGHRLVLLYRRLRSRGGFPERRLLVTDGEGKMCTVSVLAEGAFRIPPQTFGALTWSADGNHPAVLIQRPAGVDGSGQRAYTSSIITFDGHTVLPEGTQMATCVVGDDGTVSGILARRLDGSSVILLPGTPPVVARDAWGLRYVGEHLTWDTVFEQGSKHVLAHMIDAPPRHFLDMSHDAVA